MQELLERGRSYKEKYMNEKCWKVLLRFDENKKGEVLEFREDIGGIHSGLSAIVKDDRWKPVEIVRRSEAFATPLRNQEPLV